MAVLESNSHSIADIELQLGRLESAQSSLDFSLPQNLTMAHFGGGASLIQLLVSWSRRFREGRLIVDVSLEDDEKQRRLFNKSLHGLAGALMVDHIFSAIANQPIVNARPLALKRLEQMSGRQFYHRQGPRLALFCADHTQFAFPPSIYGADRRVSSDAFRYLAANVLGHLSTSPQFPMPGHFRSKVAAILYELMQNTHEWARTDHLGRLLDRSLRGILIEAYIPTEQPKGIVQSLKQAYRPLAEYFERFEQPTAFLELSVLDTGPGIAGRFLSTDVSHLPINTQQDAAMACFKLHGTSSERADKGIGLHRVLRVLTECQGFLRVRTGNLSLFRDLKQIPYDPPDTRLWDAVTNELAASRAPTVTGTLLTIILPMASKSEIQGALWERAI